MICTDWFRLKLKWKYFYPIILFNYLYKRSYLYLNVEWIKMKPAAIKRRLVWFNQKVWIQKYFHWFLFIEFFFIYRRWTFGNECWWYEIERTFGCYEEQSQTLSSGISSVLTAAETRWIRTAHPAHLHRRFRRHSSRRMSNTTPSFGPSIVFYYYLLLLLLLSIIRC